MTLESVSYSQVIQQWPDVALTSQEQEPGIRNERFYKKSWCWWDWSLYLKTNIQGKCLQINYNSCSHELLEGIMDYTGGGIKRFKKISSRTVGTTIPRCNEVTILGKGILSFYILNFYCNSV